MPTHNKSLSYKAVRMGKNPQWHGVTGSGTPPPGRMSWGSVSPSNFRGFQQGTIPNIYVSLVHRNDVVMALPAKYKETYVGFMDLYSTALDNCWPEDPDDTEEFIQLCCFIEALEDLAESCVKTENIDVQNQQLRHDNQSLRNDINKQADEIVELRSKLIKLLDQNPPRDRDIYQRRRDLREQFRRNEIFGLDFEQMPANPYDPTSDLIGGHPSKPPQPIPSQIIKDIMDDIVAGQSNLSMAQIQDILKQMGTPGMSPSGPVAPPPNNITTPRTATAAQQQFNQATRRFPFQRPSPRKKP